MSNKRMLISVKLISIVAVIYLLVLMAGIIYNRFGIEQNAETSQYNRKDIEVIKKDVDSIKIDVKKLREK